MFKGNLREQAKIEIGDLVTYRSIQELTKEKKKKKIIIHGIGIVILMDDEYTKVYWIHAKRFLWVMTDKLTTFDNLAPRY